MAMADIPPRKNKRLVSEKLCRKCEFSYHNDCLGYHCGYQFKTGTTRTAMHPEGLTAECQEFMPKQRKHRYQAPKNTAREVMIDGD